MESLVDEGEVVVSKREIHPSVVPLKRYFPFLDRDKEVMVDEDLEDKPDQINFGFETFGKVEVEVESMSIESEVVVSVGKSLNCQSLRIPSIPLVTILEEED